MIFRRSKNIRRHTEIDPDEIFIDSSNLPDFDTDQFEGQIERPISKNSIRIAGTIFLCIALFFTYKIATLQVVSGDKYRNISENNRLHHSLLFAERGAITDREGKLVAWNQIDPVQSDFSLRSYAPDAGIHNLVGYVKYPKKDKFGFYYNTEFSGADGVEKFFNDLLSGDNGLKITETDALGKTLSESVVRPPKKGDNISLSVHLGAQKAMYDSIAEIARRSGFIGGAGIVMDIKNGEVLVSVSNPEYDSNVLTDGKDVERINGYLQNKDNPFLDRVSSGLYTPGSILKPIFALAALVEGVITPEKQIESTGELKVPNPYRPGEFTVFKDWKAHGYTDMREAIAVSSDVYFYQIGGGFPGQKGLGIDNIDKYSLMFGFGDTLDGTFFSGKKGVIPTPEWKKLNFDGDIWRVGDTYNTAIGQYGFQVTPIQAVRATAALANSGTLLTPTLVSEKTKKELLNKGNGEEGITEAEYRAIHTESKKIPVTQEAYYRVVREGMRQTVTEGTMRQLNVPYVKVAGKSGTAQLGVAKKQINSWAVGFFPSDAPRYAFAVLLERGPNTATEGGTAAMALWLDWMNIYASEYLKGV
ncbi:MAG: penicillin-binding protein 2 [Patescibacteria group bacterium]|nr:penicillin-binding protein 2 [Patescibacteria group bacterium]